jgi:hypothetical protein
MPGNFFIFLITGCDVLNISFYGGFCSSKSVFFIFAHQTLHFRAQHFAVWPHFSDRFRKNHWFFKFCSAFLLVRMEWCLSESLYIELETRSWNFILRMDLYKLLRFLFFKSELGHWIRKPGCLISSEWFFFKDTFFMAVGGGNMGLWRYLLTFVMPFDFQDT